MRRSIDAAAPVLSRLYEPAQFGVLALFIALVGVAAVVAGFRFEWAIPLEKDDGDAMAVMTIALLATLAVSSALGVLLFLLHDSLVALVATPDLGEVLWLAPVALLLGGVYQALNFWCVRCSDFTAIARTRTLQGPGAAVTQLLLGVLGVGSVGLVFGQIVGTSAGTGLLWRACRRAGAFQRRPLRSDLRRMWVKHRDLFHFNTPQALLNVLGQHIPHFVFAAFFGFGTAGSYLMAQRVLGVPAGFVDQAFRQVYYQEAVTRRGHGLYRTAAKATLSLLALVSLPALVIVLWGPLLFVWALGEPWRDAGSYARLLALWSAIGVVNIPANSLIPILALHRFNLGYEVVYFIARMAAVLWGLSSGSALTVLALLCFTGCGFNLAMIGFVLRAARLDDDRHAVGVTS